MERRGDGRRRVEDGKEKGGSLTMDRWIGGLAGLYIHSCTVCTARAFVFAFAFEGHVCHEICLLSLIPSHLIRTEPR